MRRGPWLLAGVLAASVLSGCAPSDVHVSVTPAAATYDVPVTVTATGLHGGERVTLRLTTRDKKGRAWRSTVRAKADADGRLRHDAVDLISAMKPAGGEHTFLDRPADWSMRLDVLDGDHELAHVSFRRLDPVTDHLVTATDLRPSDGGLYGTLFEPAKPAADPKPAVLVFGGSEGGLASADTAAVLASHGYPSLALAYFGAPGVPKVLREVPLEYFAAAVRRLGQAPGVDPSRITIFGVSRGTEAAMLTALDFPGLVHAVIAGVPNAVAGRALSSGTPTSAWSLGGKPTAYSTNAPDAPDSPGAVLDIGRFPGRVLVDCGLEDQVWYSCSNVAALKERDPDRLTAYEYDDAGHLVGNMLPGIPSTTVGATAQDGTRIVFGGDTTASGKGRFDVWPHVLAFIDS